MYRYSTGTRGRCSGRGACELARALRVTAAAGGDLWIQEAGPSGLCEAGYAAAVSHRAIRVAGAPPLARGQHLIVAGYVAEDDGHRAIVNATITPGTPDAPSEALCERDSAVFEDPALDAVLVRSAGETAIWRDDNGGWALQTSFGGPITIVGGGRPTEWQWVVGVLGHRGPGVALVARDAADVTPAGADACL